MADSRVLGDLLHGEETAVCHPTDELPSVGTPVWGDQSYQGQAAVLAEKAPKAEDRTNRRWRTKLKTYPEVREQNRIRSKTRSRVGTFSRCSSCARLRQGPLPRIGQER